MSNTTIAELDEAYDYSRMVCPTCSRYNALTYNADRTYACRDCSSRFRAKPAPKRIEDIDMSDDARTMIEWMLAAFTGDINEAIDDARRVGHDLARWHVARVRSAHGELKSIGCLSSDAPDLIV